MYQLNDQQIDYILNDISARGIEMESLQLNLLDHVCCIIEQNLEANGDFESFYQKTIQSFYKDALWEIEEETLLLLTFKNYYTMKKIMIWSGAISALTLIFGIWFKFMYWPGASFLISTGILSSCLIFLPLLFTLKAKEKQSTKDKLLLSVAALGVIMVCLSFLFKVMHWSYSIELIYFSAVLMLFIFLPIFFLSGIKKEETKLNTITTCLLVIMVYGLLFMMVRAPSATLHSELKTMQELGIGGEILLNERRLSSGNQDLISLEIRELNKKVDKLCNECSTYLFWRDFPIDTVSDTHYREFNQNKILYEDPLNYDDTLRKKLNKLHDLAVKYNLEMAKFGSKKLSRIRVTGTVLDSSIEGIYQLSNANAMNQLNQIQMFLLQNTRTMLTLK